jgi:pilus assembly protein FimV
VWPPRTSGGILALVLALPCNGYALGLGVAHVQSALGQPLEASVEIPGASTDELARIKASIANEELFQRHGLDRPNFLSSITIAPMLDKSRGLILLIRSSEPCMEPMITFLLDVRSPDGEVVREYSVLLDPPGLTPDRKDAGVETGIASAPPSAMTAAAAISPATAKPIDAGLETKSTVGANVEPAVRLHTVAPHETLQRIVARIGAHSRSEQRRMMVAIYHDNPRAFANNMNALRVSALLHLPDAAGLAAISSEVADREFAAQMMEWKTSTRRERRRIQPTPPVATASEVRENSDADSAAQTIVLQQRIQTLEESLARVRAQLDQPPVLPAAAPAATQIEAPQSNETPPAPVREFGTQGVAVVSCCAFALALGVWFFHRRRRPIQNAAPLPFPEEQDELIAGELKALASQREALWIRRGPPNASESTARTAPINAAPTDFYQSKSNRGENTAAPSMDGNAVGAAAKTEHTGDTTVVLTVTDDPKYDETIELTLAQLMSKDSVNTTQLAIPGSLHDEAQSVERENPADALREALEREPNRADLRLKLLQLYYIAGDREGFVEIAHQLANNIHLASPQEWAKVVDMGRKIASDDPLFAGANDGQAVA